MIRRHLIIVFLYYIITFSYAQVGLFKNNSVDSVFLHSLLDKRVVIIGEVHDLNENVEFQVQTIRFLNENGYRVLWECNIATALILNQYIKDSVSLIWSFPKFEKSKIKYGYNIYNELIKNSFNGNIEYFDVKFDLNLNDWGAYVLNYRNDFYEFLSFEQIDSIQSYFNEDKKISRYEYEALLLRLYSSTKKIVDTSGVIFEYAQAFDEALKLNNKFRIIGSKRFMTYREERIIQLLEKKYFQQNDTSKYVIVTGRSHAWLKGAELVKSTFSEYLVKKLGRENVGIIISTYPRREYLSNKVKKYLGVNNDVWYNLKQLKKNLYIVKPNPDVDYLLILNE